MAVTLVKAAREVVQDRKNVREMLVELLKQQRIAAAAQIKLSEAENRTKVLQKQMLRCVSPGTPAVLTVGRDTYVVSYGVGTAEVRKADRA